MPTSSGRYIRTYLRGGHGRVYWLLLPAPRERLRAPFYEAVNKSLALLAPEFPGLMHLIPVDSVITPGYEFQSTITYEGLEIQPRNPTGSTSITPVPVSSAASSWKRCSRTGC